MKRPISYPKRNKYFASLLFHAWKMKTNCIPETWETMKTEWEKGAVSLLIDDKLTLLEVEESFKAAKQQGES